MFIIMAEYFITCLFSLSNYSCSVAYRTKFLNETVATHGEGTVSSWPLSKCQSHSRTFMKPRSSHKYHANSQKNVRPSFDWLLGSAWGSVLSKLAKRLSEFER